VSPSRALARPLLASLFIADGVDALRNPDGRVDAVRGAGLSEPEMLVKAGAVANLVGGLGLATGKLPRLSALVLVGSLVPTTYIGHAFWKAPADTRQQQQTQFLKNVSMVGGLLIAAADTGGRESLPHAAGRVTRRTRKRAEKAAKAAEKRISS
jgi:putative oxidoreductase